MPAPLRPAVRLAAACLIASTLLACNDPVGSDTPYVVTPITSTTLAGTPGWALTDTLVVEVRDAEGHLVPGAAVHWSLPDGGSLVVQLADVDDRMTGTTDHQGRNYAVWTLGMGEGTQVARAAAGTESIASFSATATALHALQVTVGDDHACAILTDQRPVCWGENRFGQLGVGDTLHRYVPTPVAGLTAALQIEASGSWHSCARDLTGDVWCWGQGSSGEAGPLASTRQATPVRVPGAGAAATISVGYQFSCAVLGIGGARCWGSNDGGRLGAGLSLLGGSNYPSPQVVVGGDDFVSLGLDGDRACAVDSEGEAWCWGRAFGGELSPYPAGLYNTPVQPIPGYKFSQVELNGYTNCGIALGGVALCWGNNRGLGYGSTPQDTPAPISPRVDGSFAQLAADFDAFYGRTRNGGLAVWGYSVLGNFGTPMEVPLPVRAIDLAAGEAGYCIIAETGALYCALLSEGDSGLTAYPVASVP